MPKRTVDPKHEIFKGWREIAAFLGQPVSVAQRWANEGMPVRRQARYVESSPEELNGWLARESAGEPVEIATSETDLSKELKRGLALLRKHGSSRGQSKKRRESTRPS